LLEKEQGIQELDTKTFIKFLNRPIKPKQAETDRNVKADMAPHELKSDVFIQSIGSKSSIKTPRPATVGNMHARRRNNRYQTTNNFVENYKGLSNYEYALSNKVQSIDQHQPKSAHGLRQSLDLKRVMNLNDHFLKNEENVI